MPRRILFGHFHSILSSCCGGREILRNEVAGYGYSADHAGEVRRERPRVRQRGLAEALVEVSDIVRRSRRDLAPLPVSPPLLCFFFTAMLQRNPTKTKGCWGVSFFPNQKAQPEKKLET